MDRRKRFLPADLQQTDLNLPPATHRHRLPDGACRAGALPLLPFTALVAFYLFTRVQRAGFRRRAGGFGRAGSSIMISAPG